MPWVNQDKAPSYYQYPLGCCDVTQLQLDHAKVYRKELTKIRESLLNAQKISASEKNYTEAKEIGILASAYLKQLRGYDLAIHWIEGTPKAVSQEIAPYVDSAFFLIV